MNPRLAEMLEDTACFFMMLGMIFAWSILLLSLEPTTTESSDNKEHANER